MTTKPQTPPAWFEQEIRAGIASLYLLCLDGAPASDHAAQTTAVWIGDIWRSARRTWDDAEADTVSIRQAFARLRGNSLRWPPLALFWSNLPDRLPSTAHRLGAPVLSLDQRRANRIRLAADAMKALGIKPDAEQAK